MNDSWLAGFFDGEGFVTISTTNYKKGTNLRVGIVNTHRPTLEAIQVYLGYGKVRLITNNEKKGWKPCYAWITDKREHVAQFLDAIQPHCITKAVNVEVGQRYLLVDRTDLGAQLVLKEELRTRKPLKG